MTKEAERHQTFARQVYEIIGSVIEKVDSGSGGDIARLLPKTLDVLADEIFESLAGVSDDNASELRRDDTEFVDLNREKWKDGFDRLRLHRQYCIEAGMIFQEQFLEHEQYLGDPLVGSLMRLHAHGCRVSGEIIALLEAGYPDGAFARWRTLHEFAVTAMLLREGGRAVAEDYVWYGLLQGASGMIGYQETAEKMGREPYTAEELEEAAELRRSILDRFGSDFLSRNGWARRHFERAKFEKLQEAAGLGHWRNDYAFASRDIHSDFREMHNLLALPRRHDPVMLCGPSDAGIVEPAHCSAIALTQLTTTFIFADMGREDSPLDYTVSIVMAKVLDRACRDVGDTFLAVHERHQETHGDG